MITGEDQQPSHDDGNRDTGAAGRGSSRAGHRGWLPVALVAAAALLATVVITAHDRELAAVAAVESSTPAGQPSTQSQSSRSSQLSSPPSRSSAQWARTTGADGVRPLLRDGPFAMLRGAPGVNAENQAEQTKVAAGGNGTILLKNGCVYVQFQGSSPMVGVFDSNSTDWNGSTPSYWGFRFSFGQPLLIGGAAGRLEDLAADGKDGYVPPGCPGAADAWFVNTVTQEYPGAGGLPAGSVVRAATPSDDDYLRDAVAIRTGAVILGYATWDAPGEHLLITTIGSSSCARRLAFVTGTGPQELALAVEVPATGPRSCTADNAPFTNEIAVPRGIVSTKPLSLLYEGTETVLPART